jgi:hypothetical protein
LNGAIYIFWNINLKGAEMKEISPGCKIGCYCVVDDCIHLAVNNRAGVRLGRVLPGPGITFEPDQNRKASVYFEAIQNIPYGLLALARDSADEMGDCVC